MLALSVEEVGLVLPVVWHGPAARRLRLAVPEPHPEILVRRCALSLEAQPGVESVRSDRLTGRILVQYGRRAPLLGRLVEVGEQKDDSRSSIANQLRRARPVPPASAPSSDTPGDEVPWHAIPPHEVLTRLEVRLEGLDERAAAARLARFGANEYEPYEAPGRLEMLLRQFTNLPAGLLLGFSALELAVREWIDAGLIDAVVTMNAAIGYRIESKNEELLESWRRLEAGEARVLRDGMLRVVPAAHLVRGDVLLCEAGDILPADARVIEAHRLTANEAPLTGESEPQRKWPDPVPETRPLAERSSMLYAGTALVSGRGRAVVTATGSGTELARIRALVDQARAPTMPLERRMEKLGRQATAFSIGAAGLTAAMGLVHGRPAGPLLRSAVALGVAAIPEGLPLIVTAAIVRCMRRMRSMNMVVRRMASVEALGGVTVICADKTGTLTANDMRLELLHVGGIGVGALRAPRGDPFASPSSLALLASALSSDVDIYEGPTGLQITGSSTERSFLAAAGSAGLDVPALRRTYPRLRLQERTAGVHYVVSLHRAPEGDAVAFIKGAPEQVLPRCLSSLEGPLTELARRNALADNESLAAEGLRVLALGWQRLPRGAPVPQSGFTFIGLAGLRDPLRPGAAGAVREAARADIRTLILTGDQGTTAAAIARQVGLHGEARDGAGIVPLLDGHDGIDAVLRNVSVVSRVTPLDKMRIVKALRDRGEIVAMVGDGINDAAALKVADVGIAIGSHASGIARQTADIVMSSEDLGSILAAVGQGRIVQDNLRRTVRFLFSTNLSEILLVMAGAAFGQELLTPMQLLWINLLTDSLPALALALEPGEQHVLDRKPAPPNEPIVHAGEWKRIWRDAALLATVFGGGTFLAGGPGAVFAALPAAHLAYASLCRSDAAPAGGHFDALLGASAATHLAVCTLPGLRRILGLPAPTPAALLGFGAGISWPWLLGRGGREIVVGNQPDSAKTGPGSQGG